MRHLRHLGADLAHNVRHSVTLSQRDPEPSRSLIGHWKLVIGHSGSRKRAGGIPSAFYGRMETGGPGLSQPATDITFACAHCGSALVVDAAAAGMTLDCSQCGKPTQVPAIAERETEASRLAKEEKRMGD